MKLRCDWQEHINERIEKPLRLFREWNVRVYNFKDETIQGNRKVEDGDSGSQR